MTWVRLVLLGLLCLTLPTILLAQSKFTLHVTSRIGEEAIDFHQHLEKDNNFVILNGGISKRQLISYALSEASLPTDFQKRLFINDGADEWRNGQSSGYENVRDLDTQLDLSIGRDLIIGKGCAGPEEVELDEDNILVFISSSWFLHRQYKPIFSASDCDYLYPEDIWGELKDILDKNDESNVFLFTYHAKSQKDGFTWRDIFAPHHGPDYSINSHDYNHFSKHLEQIVDEHKNAYLISANLPKIGLIDTLNGVEINMYRGSKDNWLKIEISTQNDVKICQVNQEGEKNLYKKSLVKDTVSYVGGATISDSDSVVLVPGAEYKVSEFAELWLGRNFRQEWTTPVKIPILNISTYEGGLKPYAIGGGMQTNSLKFKTSDGRKFAFRSVDKDTRKQKSLPIMQTLVGAVKQDQISSQLPFGDIFTGRLLDYSDILHVTPKAYVMGNQAALGKYRSRFAGVLATVEEKPQGKNKTKKAFAEADKIFSTHEVYRELLEDRRNTIDPLSFAKATLFSIWIADWDRHQDNFKWAGFKEDGVWTFKPIPRDRDHVIALWEGVFGNFSDWLVPNVAEFKEKIGNVKYLTFQGKSLQNFIAPRVDKETWLEAADYLMELYDEEKIENAWSYIPEEIQDFSYDRIKRILLARKPQLRTAALDVYALYRSELDIYLSDKDDYVEVDNESIAIYEEKKGDKGDLIETIAIDPKITEVVNIYALDGKDIVDLSRRKDASIKARVVLGPGEDEVRWPDDKTVKGLEVYNFDQQEEDERYEKTHRQIQANLYDFNYNSLLPFPIVVNNSDLGLGLEVKMQRLTQKWNKRPYGSKQTIGLRYFPSTHSLRLSFTQLTRNMIGDWHGDIYFRAADNDTRFDNYTGINTLLPKDFRKNQRLDQLYYVNNSNFDLKLGLRNEIYGLSRFQTQLALRFFHIGDNIQEGFALELEDQLTNFQTTWYNRLDLNFMDNDFYPTEGTRYDVETHTGYTWTGNKGFFYTLNASILRAITWKDISRTILLAKGGWKTAGGETRFFNLPSLGNRQDLRGTFNDVLRADQVFYFNSEVRKEVWDSENSILPFVLGISAFYDRAISTYEVNGSRFQSSYGYGGGFYLSILNKQYTIFTSLGESNLDTGKFLDMGLNFRFE
jgi:hypothetical protein